MGNVFKALKKAGMASSSIPKREHSSSDLGESVSQSCPDDTYLKPDTGKLTGQQPDKPVRDNPVFSLERSDWDERLTLSTAVSGSVAESFRSLRTKILHPESNSSIRSVLITSAMPGEGKSFVSANLGVSFAQGMDHKGLLLNCDLRKPSLERMFGLPNEYGLVDVLKNNMELNSVITPAGIDKLHILPAGRPPVNPAELLGSSTMRKLIDDLEQQDEQRILLLDSPPLHSAAETAVLIKYVDAVVLVVRYGKSRKEHVQSVVEQIGKDKIIGIVFNAYETSPLEEKLFGSYEGQYGYYYEEPES
jgi:capsular exopolysaccharide synthesis family protein